MMGGGGVTKLARELEQSNGRVLHIPFSYVTLRGSNGSPGSRWRASKSRAPASSGSAWTIPL
eukprot:14067835-Heterocapsa_arctica.AAC.1